MSHQKQIIVNCWKCKKPFDIVSAEKCYEHLVTMDGSRGWTTKCSHCGACICKKASKMKDIDCEVLNNAGIHRVMPSVHRQLTKEKEGQP